MAKVFRLVAAAVAVICVSGAAFAQTAATGNIEGVVTDASGGVLPGVTVVIKNAETNVAREVTSDSGGRYRATALQPGIVRSDGQSCRVPGAGAWPHRGPRRPDPGRRRGDASRGRVRSGDGHRRKPAHRHAAHRRQQRGRRTGDREPADQRPPLGELRPARPRGHERR